MRLSYFGKNYHGWQVQPNAISVQSELNRILSTIVGEEIHVVGAGRTDTGVHAREMWAHLDTSRNLDQNVLHKVNSFIGPDIAVHELHKVPDEAHARFDATGRSYEYHITRKKDPFKQDDAWFFPWELNLELMQQASEVLLAHEDFSAFSRSNTQTKTNLCEIGSVKWEERGDLLIFHITANRFLRNMVRAIVGTLVAVGQGKVSLEEFEQIILSKDRRLAGESAPAHGLYLTRVSYPKDIFNG